MTIDIKNLWAQFQKPERLFEYSVYAFVFTLPLWRSINTIFIWPMVITWVVAGNWPGKVKMLKANKKSFSLIASLLLLLVLGLLFSSDTKDNLKDIESSLAFLILPLVIFSSELTALVKKRVFIVLGAGLFLGICICWGYVIADILSKHDPWEQTQYFFKWIYTHDRLLMPIDIHPGYFAAMLVLFITTLFFDASFSGFRKKKLPFLLLTSFFLLFLIATSSRIGFVALVLICGLQLIKEFNIKKGFIFFTALAAMVLLSIKFDYFWAKFKKTADDSSILGIERIDRWRSIWDGFSQTNSYVFGVGPGDVDELYQNAYQKGGFELAYQNRYNAHNQYLEFLVASGFMGLLLYIFILAHFAQSTKLGSICLQFFVIVALVSITESIFGRSRGVIFFSFFYAFLLNSSNYPEKV